MAVPNSRVWEQRIIKLVVGLAQYAELCFESHHRKSIHWLLYRQGFTSVPFNEIDILSSWSLSSGGEGWGLYPLASTMTQSVSPGICPVTGTKTGMGSGLSYSKLCLSWEMPTPPPPPLWPVALPSPPPSPPGQWSSVLELRGGMLTSSNAVGLKSWHFRWAPHINLELSLTTRVCTGFYKLSSHKHSLASKKLWGGCSNVSGVGMVTATGNFLCVVVEEWRVCCKLQRDFGAAVNGAHRLLDHKLKCVYDNVTVLGSEEWQHRGIDPNGSPLEQTANASALLVSSNSVSRWKVMLWWERLEAAVVQSCHSEFPVFSRSVKMILRVSLVSLT